MYIRTTRAFENESFNFPCEGCITDMPEHMAREAISQGNAVEVTSDEWIAYRTRTVETMDAFPTLENASINPKKAGRKNAGTANSADASDIFE